MGSLISVIRCANVLNGERNAPELPIPISAIEQYAKRYKMSPVFVMLVLEYDAGILSGAMERMGSGSSGDKTPKKLL